MSYLYETHLHTCQGSACGKSTGAEHVRYYKDLGYTGIFVTDHFYRGNCAIPREMPWKEWVNRFCAGYEDARNEGARVGLDVFFAWEESIHGDDYLIYGLDKEWLLEHPEVRTWTRREQYEAVHAAGGAVIQAHPFRIRDYIKNIYLARDYVDGVEIANAGNEAYMDVYANRYAHENDFVMTAGSDNHRSDPAGDPAQIFGVVLQERLASPADYARIIRSRQPIGLRYPESRVDPANAQPLSLNAFYVQGDESLVPAQVNWFNC